jgi:hypothetical protein
MRHGSRPMAVRQCAGWLQCHPRARRPMLLCLGVWKLTLGVLTFKMAEAALHNPDVFALGGAVTVAAITAAPSVLLMWASEDS